MSNATKDTYNGYANYETWLIKLWLDNEEGRDAELRSMAADCLEDAEGETGRPSCLTAQDRAIQMLADRLEEQHEEGISLTGADVYADLIKCALGRVDWMEIASAIFEIE